MKTGSIPKHIIEMHRVLVGGVISWCLVVRAVWGCVVFGGDGVWGWGGWRVWLWIWWWWWLFAAAAWWCRCMETLGAFSAKTEDLRIAHYALRITHWLLPGCRVAGLPGCRVAGLPGCRCHHIEIAQNEKQIKYETIRNIIWHWIPQWNSFGHVCSQKNISFLIELIALDFIKSSKSLRFWPISSCTATFGPWGELQQQIIIARSNVSQTFWFKSSNCCVNQWPSNKIWSGLSSKVSHYCLFAFCPTKEGLKFFWWRSKARHLTPYVIRSVQQPSLSLKISMLVSLFLQLWVLLPVFLLLFALKVFTFIGSKSITRPLQLCFTKRQSWFKAGFLSEFESRQFRAFKECKR